MQPLANGNTFVGWGSQRWFSEYDANGRLIFNGRLAKGNDLPRISRPGVACRRARPQRSERREDAPRQLERRHPGRHVAGRRQEATRGTGFETSVPAPNRTAVRALDANGVVLGESPAR